jgi:3-methyladenine DNA glycosylase/8-oxoguanine DNA glycosylase
VSHAPREIEVRRSVRPPWPFRLPRRLGLDHLMRRRGDVLHRLVHHESEPIVVRVAQLSSGDVLFGARARSRAAAEYGIERMRFCLGVDVDLREFHDRFRADPLIGEAVRRDPALRLVGRPDPFEALTWAICEQLIEYERAAAIQRRLVSSLGCRHEPSGLRDAPTAGVVAAQAPALLTSYDLSAARSLALIRAAREVAAGRVDLHDGDHSQGWRRLRAIPGIGSWTVQILAVTGQGRLDQLPAGDLAYLKLVGRLTTGDPFARASETEVEEFFAPYAPWGALAGAYALRSAAAAGVGAGVSQAVLRIAA